MIIIKNGKIHVGDGKVLENQDILVNNKKIEQIGINLKFEGAKIIDATGMDVFPGFIDPESSYGCIDSTFKVKDSDEISNPITPDAKIKYAFNHDEILLEELYKVGITSIGAAPGDLNIIGGQMALYKTWGQNSKKMLIREPIGLKGSVIHSVKETYGERKILPMTRMGIFGELEKLLDKSNRNLLNENKDESKNTKEIVEKVLKKKIPLFITANTVSEINALMKIVEKFDIDLVICGAFQSDRCIEYIKGKNISIIVGEQTNLTARKYNNTDLYKISQLEKDGNLISFSLTSSYGPEGKVKYLWNAIEFYKAGVKSEDVVKMMTINPAKILGVDDILGTIEEGKQADIVIFSNNPIECYDSKALYTIVGGELVYEKGGEKLCY